jgi:hypothetical protein
VRRAGYSGPSQYFNSILETNVIAIREVVDEVRLASEQELPYAIRILLLDEWSQ